MVALFLRNFSTFKMILQFFTAISRSGVSGFAEYVSEYFEFQSYCDEVNCKNSTCNLPMCERKCANFEFEYDGVVGLNSMKRVFEKMKDDVQRELGSKSDQHGILIKEKLIGPNEELEDRNILLVDRNGDGRLNPKGIYFYLQCF